MHEKHKTYNLFLDDMRYPKDVKWIELPLVPWIIVRSHDAFVRHIQNFGVPQLVTFDHDLCDEHYQEYSHATDERMVGEGKEFRYDKMKEKTGRDSALWLANHCIENGIPIPQYFVHTLNGIGAKNIVSILESAHKAMAMK